MGNPDNPGEVIINGNRAGTVVTFVNNETEAAVLNGFTITNGAAGDWAAGITILGSSPTITHCQIVANRSERQGGGLYVSVGSPVITNCDISSNFTPFGDEYRGRGGGIYCAPRSRITLEDCAFIANTGTYGIHLYCDGSEAILRNCVFNTVGGRAEYQSGIVFTNSTAVMENCQLLHLPRAVVASTSILSITGSLFSDSRGSGEYSPGAAIYASNGSVVEVAYSVFERGGSFDAGSAIYSEVLGDGEESEVIARNCTFANNQAANVVENIAAVNCIFLNNEAEWHRDNVINFCLVGREAAGEGNIFGQDPLFVDAEAGDYRLTADSPCIDAGDPESPRDPDGTRADMGAFYYHQGPGIVVSDDSLHFGEVQIDSALELTLTLTNRGNAGLEVFAVEIDDEVFTHNFIADTVVQPEGEYVLTVIFSPNEVREYAASLTLASNDPVDSLTTIRLSGIGVPPNAVGRNFTRYPSSFSFSNFPNPFNTATTIAYGLPNASPVWLRLYDLSGREVRTLIKGNQMAGIHRTILSAGDIPSGLYLVRFEAGEYLTVKKVMFIR